jgi:endonuclease G, mitochondrial
MSVIQEQIQKAQRRLEGIDPHELLARTRDKNPVELSSASDRAARRNFLRESLADEARADAMFERIIAGNELQDVNYLARGTRAARSVTRIAIREPNGRLAGWGTGLLIAPNVLMTNHHVLSESRWALRSEAQFQFERDIDGRQIDPAIFLLEPQKLFFTAAALDFTVVAVAPQAQNSDRPLSTYDFLPLVGTLGKVTEGEWLTIIQHPNGERKQVCVRENRFIKRTDDVLWYSTDTVGGSSGSPVFNNDWYVVALHHSGIPEEKNGRIQTVDGRDYDPPRDGDDRIKWIANEGIRVSRIVETLRRNLPQQPLLQQVFNATPSNARLPEYGDAGRPAANVPTRLSMPLSTRRNLEEPSMSDAQFPKRITVGLRIEADGTVAVESSSLEGTEALPFEDKTLAKKEPAFDVPFDATYIDRKGFDVDFLGGGENRINFPTLSPALEHIAAKLLKPKNGDDHILHYHNFSVVMHAKRRFAIYSAANISFAGRFEMSRPADVWREDPRIAQDAQITNFYYKGNQFDRGHLTRREDLEFGAKALNALQSAADTCHWTNCTPQHKQFNQNKQLWQGIERHILEDAIVHDHFNSQVITGSILEEDDPVYETFPKIQYPVRFWKVVAALSAQNKLFATAYILDQTDVIARFGLKEAAAIPFTAYKTFQVKIAEVERLTGLTFSAGAGTNTRSLSEFDPLAKAGAGRRRPRPRRPGFEEAAVVDTPEGYLLLDSLEAIELGD